MSTAEPHPESVNSRSVDSESDEQTGVAAEVNERQGDTQGTPREDVNDALPLPNDPVDHMLSANDLNGEPPD